MTPSQNYKSSRRGFGLAELIIVMGIMIGIGVGAFAYLDAASAKADKAKTVLAPDVLLALATPAGRAYNSLLQNALGNMDTSLQNGAWPHPGDILTDDTAITAQSGRHYYMNPKNNREWPERSVAAKLCRAKMLDREGWSCQILDNVSAPYWLIRITVPESALGSN